MKTYKPSPIPRETDPRLWRTLKQMDEYLRELQSGMLLIDRGLSPTQGSTPIPVVDPSIIDHGELTGLVPTTYEDNDDHTQYLNILGRDGGQTAYLATAGSGGTNTWAVGDGEVMSKEGGFIAATGTGLTMESACTVGQTVLMVVGIAGNNNTLTSGDGATNYITSLTDPVGNTWTKLHEYSLKGAGGVRNEIVALFYSVIANTYNTINDNIVINCSVTQDSAYLIGYAFTGVTSPTVVGTTKNNKTDGVADWESLTHNDATAGNSTLYIRAGTAWRASSTAQWTGTSGWTDAAANWNDVTLSDPSGSRMEFKISTSGSETSDPTELQLQYHADFLIALQSATVPASSYIYSSEDVDEAYIKWTGPQLELNASGGLTFTGDITAVGDAEITGDVDIIGALTLDPTINLLNTNLFGDVVAGAAARGDLIVGNATPAWEKLTIGAASAVLTSDGTDAAWTLPTLDALDDTNIAGPATNDLLTWDGSDWIDQSHSEIGIASSSNQVTFLNNTIFSDVNPTLPSPAFGAIILYDGSDWFALEMNPVNAVLMSDAFLGPIWTTPYWLELAGGTMSGNIVMGDHSITGIDTITFTDVAGTIAGIQNQNLVDRSDSLPIIIDDTATEAFLVRKAADALDVFHVDTTNQDVEIGDAATVSAPTLRLWGSKSGVPESAILYVDTSGRLNFDTESASHIYFRRNGTLAFFISGTGPNVASDQDMVFGNSVPQLAIRLNTNASTNKGWISVPSTYQVIIGDQADRNTSKDFTTLTSPTFAQPNFLFTDSDLDSYIQIGHKADDQPFLNAENTIDFDIQGTTEMTVASGVVTIANELVIPSGTADPSSTVGSLFLRTDLGTNGTLRMYANGAWRTVATL